MYLIPECLQNKEYSFLRVYQPQMGEEYEVTYDAMRNLNKYPYYSNRKVEKKDAGYCLSGNNGLDISADCMTSFLGAYGPVLNYIEKDEETIHLIDLFRYIYHTIGNFIPLPEGCNAGTWGNDNYSYKLNEIRILFQLLTKRKEEDVELNIVSDSNQKAFDEIKKAFDEKNKTVPSKGRVKVAYWIKSEWIDKEKGWYDFYNELFFQDYVENNGKVKDFYGNQRFVPKKCQDVNKIKNSIRNTIDLIIKRGYRIKKLLKGPLEPNDIKEIKEIEDKLYKMSFQKALISIKEDGE